jgi:nicotinamide-nucleotide amidase
VDALANRIEEELEDLIYSSQGETLEQIVLFYLEMRGATLSVAESCTGGLISERLTSISGSSRSFVGGAVVYSNELKSEFANVPPSVLERHGAVSKETASAMAEGIRERCDTTLGVGVTGIAGPTGGTADKPVGLVYIGVSDGKKTDVVERKFTGDRDRIRTLAAQTALDLVRRKLM